MHRYTFSDPVYLKGHYGMDKNIFPSNYALRLFCDLK